MLYSSNVLQNHEQFSIDLWKQRKLNYKIQVWKIVFGQRISYKFVKIRSVIICRMCITDRRAQTYVAVQGHRVPS